MKPVKDLVAGDEITWIHIHADGSETTRTGVVWNAGPILGGIGTFWVTPDQPDPADPYPPCVLVTPARQRTYVGRVWNYDNGPKWEPRGGRIIPRGTLYSEQHHYSATGAENLRVAQIAAKTRTRATV